MCKVILQGKNVLKSSLKQAAGIRVGISGVTFDGDGSLEVHGGEQWPGIGNSNDQFNIIINGGTIDAYGGLNGAGIGNSNTYAGGKIEINGGNITAHGGENAAGIGTGGYYSKRPDYSITITNGTITAYGGAGSAGIGSGRYFAGSNINISGGVITAKGEGGAEDIGSGAYGRSNNNNITGGTINGVDYNFTEPSYTVTIPANINLQIGNSTSAEVKVENVCIPYGKSVSVIISNASPTPNVDKFHVQSGTNVLDYKISKDGTGSAISVNSEIMSVIAGTKESTATLTFTPPEEYTYSGTYAGTITFTVSVS